MSHLMLHSTKSYHCLGTMLEGQCVCCKSNVTQALLDSIWQTSIRNDRAQVFSFLNMCVFTYIHVKTLDLNDFLFQWHFRKTKQQRRNEHAVTVMNICYEYQINIRVLREVKDIQLPISTQSVCVFVSSMYIFLGQKLDLTQ